MQESIQYIGEHIYLAHLGQYAIFLSFASAILTALSFWQVDKPSEKIQANNWIKIGKIAWWTHCLSLWSLIGLLFFIMIQHYYEFHYVWQHVSDDLPMKYIFSAFWEGQEGSFLLWLFWHAVLGTVLLYNRHKYKYTGLAVLGLIQAMILSMILGVYVPGLEWKIGSNPFVFIRDVMNIPLFNNPNYITLIKGNGLNPLLQNYWMTIHPPTLFLGFASTAIPYAFAIAGLRLRDHKGWLAPAFGWVLFAGAILGLGILMGGAWAYEALSFGGYWAWDPVENMSLVPWLILLAGLHTHLIAKNTPYSLKSAYVFYLLSFVLVVYSTFLTRSGVLGDTSVHSFTEMGLEWQLIIFILLFGLGAIYFYWKNKESISTPKEEESLFSREFWMFIGSMVFLFSCSLISFTTSIPVFNKIISGIGWLLNTDLKDWHRSTPVDPVAHHNRFQLWVGVLLSLLSIVAMLLKYRMDTNPFKNKSWVIRIVIGLISAVILHIGICYWINVDAWQHHLLLFSGVFAICMHFILFLKNFQSKIQYLGSYFSHIGFGILIVGVIASGLNKRFISSNPFITRGLIADQTEDELAKNIRLDKNMPMYMSGFLVEYQQDTFAGVTRTFDIHFKKLSEDGEKTVEEFTVQPNILYSKDFTKIAASNPSTKHYWNKDIFTHIASLPTDQVSIEEATRKNESIVYDDILVSKDKWVSYQDSILIKLDKVKYDPEHHDLNRNKGDFGISADVWVKFKDSVYSHKPLVMAKEGLLLNMNDHNNQIGLNIRVNEKSLAQILAPTEGPNMHSTKLRPNEVITWEGRNIQFLGFSKNISNPHFKPNADDIVLGANILVGDGAVIDTIKPLYIIRGNQPFSIADHNFKHGINIKLTGIDIPSESALLEFYPIDVDPKEISMQVARVEPKFDFVVLQAIEFPGINLVWAGSLLMLFGLAIGIFKKNKRKNQIE